MIRPILPFAASVCFAAALCLGSASAAPVIHTIVGTSTTAGGTNIDLTGTGFGSSGALVKFGANLATVSSQTDTSLRVIAPAGQGAALNVTVTAAGAESAPILFSYSPPLISGISPTRALASQATQITLTGISLGVAPIVTFGSTSGMILVNSHTSITVIKPPDSGGDLQVRVTVGGQTSNLLNFRSVNLTSLPGYYVDLASEIVVPAPAGAFTANANQTTATLAPVGHYAPIAGMRAALPASPGYFVANIGSASQTPAPPGNVSQDAGASMATPAAIGQYAPVLGMREAIPASPGYFVPNSGASAQFPASVGKFVPVSGSATQADAPAGSYAPITGMSAAIPAPIGTYSPTVGSASVIPVPAGFTTTGAGATGIIPLPQVGITAYQLESNGDNTLTFPSDSGQNYAIYYSENLVDFALILTVSGTGNPITRTLSPPTSATGKRFFVVARLSPP